MNTSGRRVAKAALIGWLVACAAVVHGEETPAGQPAPLLLGRVRALIVSPHPDDGTLGAGGLIQQVIREGGSVQVVQLTGGDAFPRGVITVSRQRAPTPAAYRSYGAMREREAILAMRHLGLQRSQIRLLGFPDEGLCALASTNRVGPAFESPYTKRESPPDSEQIVPGTMYRGEDVIRELARLIMEVRPTLVVLPHSGDQHPDHCAAHLLVHQALSAAAAGGLGPPRVLHYVVHYPEWPIAEAPDHRLNPPTAEVTRSWQWRTLLLSQAERRAKRMALDDFYSQMLMMPDFLKSFVRENELFIEGEPPLPVPCWCSGDNIAAIPPAAR